MMHAETLLTSADVTRTWRVAPNHIITLSHFPLTDSSAVTVDGISLPPGHLSFELDREPYQVQVISSSWLARAGLATWTYSLTLHGRALPDIIHEPVPDSSVRAVPPNVTEPVVAGDKVVWYRITWQGTSTQPAVDVHRRYRDFFMLYSQICSAYRGSHLYTSVPELPGRELLSPDQLSPDFIAERRVGLEVWLRRLVKLPGVLGGRNPDVEEFLGTTPTGLAETSLVFRPGKLGMRLAKPVVAQQGRGSFSAQVAAFLNEDDGTPGQAEASGRVRVGDMVVRVQGDSALLIEYSAVVDKLRMAPRPLVVHFFGARGGE